MAGEGQMLQAARKEKQWSFTEAEDITKIRVRYIQALEEENYEILPGTTYAKGYLRTYSKQLGLNPDEIMALYNASATPDPIPVVNAPNQQVKVRPLWVRPAIIGSISVMAIVLVITIAISQSGKKIVDPPYAPAALPSAPQTAQSTPAPTVPVAPNPTNVAATTQDGLTMQIVFTQPCWIEIRVDGQPSLQGTFIAGTSKEVKGASKIELTSVGNAGGVTVTLNGKAYPSLGKSGQVVHNIVLTQDTLKSL
jgi:cytoskeleton protein RodZ